MSNFRIPGPLCQEVQDSQKAQGSPSDQDLIGYLDAFSYEALESSVKNLSSFIPVQVDSVSLNKLKKKKDKSFGLNVALVQVFGNPAIVEFNVKMWRTYYGLGSIKRKTGEIDTSPTYLNGTSRAHYLVGDIILTSKYEWKHVLAKAGLEYDKDGTSLVEFLLFILNDFNKKTYIFGYLIIEIHPKGDGTGKIDLQPVILSGGLPCPIGRVQSWYVRYSFSEYDRSRNLNYQWFHRKEADLLLEFSNYIRIIAEYGLNTLQKAGRKVVLKVVKKPIKKRFMKTIKNRLVRKIPSAGLAFILAFASEVASTFKASHTEMISKEGKAVVLKKTLNNKAVVQRALEKSVAAFIAVLFSESVGISLDKLLPKAVVDSFGQRTARWLLVKKAKFIENLLKGLIELHADSIDPVTGKLDDQKINQGSRNFAGKQLSIFKEMFDDIVDAMAEAIFN